MSATSLEGARHLMKIANNSAHHINNSNKGILVGGSDRNEVHLSPQEVNMIKSFLASSSNVLSPTKASSTLSKELKVRDFYTEVESMLNLMWKVKVLQLS